jgi:hypothetical protein
LKGSANYQNKNKDKENDTEKTKILVEELMNHLCLFISYNIDAKDSGNQDLFKNKIFGKSEGEYIALKLANESIEKLESEFRSNFEEKILCDIEPVNDLMNNMKYLMSYYMKYKKVSILSYKMNSHQYILNSFKFRDTLEAIQSLKRDENIEKKLSIILECTNETLKNLAKRMNSSLQNIALTYEQLLSLNIFSDNNDIKDEAEPMIFKNLIETTLIIRDIWALLRGQIYVEKQKIETINQYLTVTDKINELYAIQMQLRSISIHRIFKKLDREKPLDPEYVMEQIFLLLSEVDGLIGRLESIYKDKLESEKADPKGTVINFNNLGYDDYVSDSIA